MHATVADAIAAARAAGQQAMSDRHPGQVIIGGETCNAAVVISRGQDVVDARGIVAAEAISVLITEPPLGAMLPTSGIMIEHVETGRRYEIVSTRRDGSAWILRAATFPGLP